MKKSLLTVIGFAVALSASAAEYPTMAFEMADGSVLSVESENLSMAFSAESFLANHSGGHLEIPVSELRKLYFVASSAGIVASVAEADSRVEVFSTTGIWMGSYNSEADARASLPRGIYVMKSVSGTFKSVVK